jgi:AcrR family transcriptional regulator
LEAVTALAAQAGYGGLTVESVDAEAGLSRATFYQYFSSVEDCFWSAYRHHSEQLLLDARRALRGAPDGRRALLDLLLDLALSRPSVVVVLFSQGLGAGPSGVLARDRLLSHLERALASSEQDPSLVDVPDAILIGATARFLAMRISAGEMAESLREEVHDWAEGFLRAPGEPCWSIDLAPKLQALGSQSPQRTHSPRLEGSARKRIIDATAVTVYQRSYAASTVAHIASAARVSRRSFYNEFAGKPDAFIAAYEHGFQMILTAAAPAFFSPGEWPERVWQSALAFTRQLEREPAFAHLGFVECYALGPSFESRLREMQFAFTLFLDDGHRQNGAALSPSQPRSALTASAIMEAGFQVASRSPGLYIRRMQPLAVYIALSSVIGSDAAGQFVAAKLASQRPRTQTGLSVLS